jgi:hypothetical protein
MELLAHELLKTLEKTEKSDRIQYLFKQTIEIVRESSEFETSDVSNFFDNLEFLQHTQTCIRPLSSNLNYLKVLKGIVDARDDLYSNPRIQSEIKRLLTSLITQGIKESGLVAYYSAKPYFNQFLYGPVRITGQFHHDMKVIEREVKYNRYLNVQYEMLYLIFQLSIGLKDFN